MENWEDSWCKWIVEGNYISYYKAGVLYYEYVIGKELTHWEWKWGYLNNDLTTITPITPGTFTQQVVPDNFEITVGYDSVTNTNQLWQFIFGIKTQCYIYIQLPTDLSRHSLPKLQTPGATFPQIGHFEEWMSPFEEPSFVTEHFLIRPDLFRCGFTAYNPKNVTLTPELNFFINKLLTERIGWVNPSNTALPDSEVPARAKYAEILDKLFKKVVPCRPISLYPIRAPAVAATGQ
jgi:hypothetical protein